MESSSGSRKHVFIEDETKVSPSGWPRYHPEVEVDTLNKGLVELGLEDDTIHQNGFTTVWHSTGQPEIIFRRWPTIAFRRSSPLWHITSLNPPIFSKISSTPKASDLQGLCLQTDVVNIKPKHCLQASLIISITQPRQYAAWLDGCKSEGRPTCLCLFIQKERCEGAMDPK